MTRATLLFPLAVAVTLAACSPSLENGGESSKIEGELEEAKFVNREVRASDLYVPYPHADSVAAASNRMNLVDLLGEEDAKRVAAHITLKTKTTPLDRAEESEAARFWRLAPDDPKSSPVGRHEPKFKACLEDPRNMVVSAVRFAPFESILPGAIADWEAVIPGRNLAKTIQLRFVMQANCDTDDAAVHVIYNLEPKELRSQFLTVERSLEVSPEKPASDVLGAANRLSALTSTPTYDAWRIRTINTWLDATGQLTRSSLPATVAQLDSLPEKFLAQAKERGFGTDLFELVRRALGQSLDRSKPQSEIGLSALADPTLAGAFQASLLALVRESARLSVVTTFSGNGFEVWSFGALKPSRAGQLEPIELKTVNTFREGQCAAPPCLAVRQTSRLGMYENAVELNKASRLPGDSEDDVVFAGSILNPRIFSWFDFGKTNAFFVTGGVQRTTDPRTASAVEPAAPLTEQTADIAHVNSSNMTCGTCHATLERGAIGPGANLHMLSGRSRRMNARSAAELVHEVREAKSLLKN